MINSSLQEKFGDVSRNTPRVAIKPRDRIFNVPRIEPIEDLRLIEAYFSSFFSDITRPGQEMLLDQCYVSPTQVKEFSRELQKLLDYSAALDEVKDPIQAATQDSVDAEIDVQLELSSPRTILLVGNVGVGKSTFVHRFNRDRLEGGSKARNVCIVVDLINHPNIHIVPNQAESEVLAEMVLDRLAAEMKDVLDPFHPAVIRGCFERDVARFKSLWKNLAISNAHEYTLKEEEHIAALANSKHKHLIGYVGYARKKGKRCWIVFDNADRGSDLYQSFIYTFAHDLSSRSRCVTLITLREDTYIRAQSGFLDVRNTDKVLRLHPASLQQVVSKRRKYVEHLLERNILADPLKKHGRFISLLNSHVTHVFLGDSKSIHHLVSAFSLNNIRQCLSMLKAYYTSLHSSFHNMVARCDPAARVFDDVLFDHKREYDRFIQALMLNNSWSYKEHDSEITNLFAVNPLEQGSHFLALRILAYLHLRHSSTGRHHSLPYDDISKEFVYLGYSREQITKVIGHLLAERLLVSPQLSFNTAEEKRIVVPDPLPEVLSLALSFKGDFYLRNLVSHPYYLTRVGEDTVWYNESLVRSYTEYLQEAIDSQPSFGVDDALIATKAREVFIQYLRKSFTEECQGSDAR